MMTKITGETPFQVLTSNFSISPSNEGYTLQISADGKQFSNLFSVGAGVTRLVTDVAANSWYRLLGNESAVVINWQRMCVTDGGGSGGSGATYTAGTYIDITQDVISVTGITPDLYATSADVQSAYTILDAHIDEVEEIAASGYTELHDGLMEVSGRTSLTSGDVQTQIAASVSGKADKMNIEANTGLLRFPTWNEQGVVTGYAKQAYRPSIKINGKTKEYVDLRGNGDVPDIWAPNSAGTAGDILMSSGSGNAPVWVTPATINGSAITAGGNLVIEGGSGPAPDLSGYMTSGDAQVISTALNDLNTRVSGLSAASADYLTSADTQDFITSAATAHMVVSSDDSIVNIVKIEQTDYDTLVAQSATTPTTLYVVVPDSI